MLKRINFSHGRGRESEFSQKEFISVYLAKNMKRGGVSLATRLSVVISTRELQVIKQDGHTNSPQTVFLAALWKQNKYLLARDHNKKWLCY